MRKTVPVFLAAILASTALTSTVHAAGSRQAAANAPNTPAPVPAAPAPSVADPLQNRTAAATPEAIGTLMARGVKITALGSVGGVDGYLIESADGKVQPAYLTPDGKHLVIGPMYLIEQGGRSLYVTGQQIEELKQRVAQERAQREDEARRAAEARVAQARQETADAERRLAAAQQQFSVPVPGVSGTVGGPTAPITPAPVSPPPPPPTPALPSLPAPTTGSGLNPSVAAPAMPTPTPEAAAPSAAEFANNKFDKEGFSKIVDGAAWFRVGPEELPAVYMVADPQCPFYHAAWAKLKPLVDARKLTVRVILIDGLPGSKPLVLSLLMNENPAEAWYNGKGSEDRPVVPLTAPSAEDQKKDSYHTAEAYLNMNDKAAGQLGVKQTPFLAYVGKDNKVYSAAGPKDMTAFLSALVAPTP